MPTPIDDFLADMLPSYLAAEHALCGGDPAPRSDTWSHADPVTLFGAAQPVRQGWDEVSNVFRALADRFDELRDYRLELLAAGVDRELGYTVGLEHKTVVVDGEPATYTLRVTSVYRREDGRWKVVHRHGDHHVEPAAAADGASS